MHRFLARGMIPVCAWVGGWQASAQDFLLIPDSANDAVGMYSPADGAYLGDLIADSDPGPGGVFDTPIKAVLGPDGLLYISDQMRDSVLRFDLAGSFVDVFCDSTSGLDNVRGIAFLDDNLLVCYSPLNGQNPAVARFSSDGVRLADFAGGGIDPYDVYMSVSNVLVSDVSTNSVKIYDLNGQLLGSAPSAAFPEQVARRGADHEFFTIAYAGDMITEFALDGSVLNSLPITGLGRGVTELADGNLLITTGSSVRIINPLSGAAIRTVRTGTGFRLIQRIYANWNQCAYAGCNPSDFNGDCVVDLADLSVLLANFGFTGPPGSLPGDTNADGVVDLTDLGTMLTQFGNYCNP